MEVVPVALGESESSFLRPSNLRGGKNAPQKIGLGERRISFRDLARFVYGKQWVAIIAGALGKDVSTVKRWCSRRARAPDCAVMLLLSEITRRYG